MKQIRITIILSFLIITIVGCQSKKTKQSKQLKTDAKTVTALQSAEDLLCGTSRAVCYSGFRTGQHPDRGDGAVLPTEEQILEDLFIISKDSLFNLIRLY
ncbi:MAG: hypothetical protein MI866_06810, partial [Bacteroidales bacterium]|nr:hypothetical protein [Bacteroidales bacterium]